MLCAVVLCFAVLCRQLTRLPLFFRVKFELFAHPSLTKILQTRLSLAILWPQIVDGGLVPSLLREAMRRANEERPGSVHLELPEDVAREKVRTHPGMAL